MTEYLQCGVPMLNAKGSRDRTEILSDLRHPGANILAERISTLNMTDYNWLKLTVIGYNQPQNWEIKVPTLCVYWWNYNS